MQHVDSLSGGKASAAQAGPTRPQTQGAVRAGEPVGRPTTCRSLASSGSPARNQRPAGGPSDDPACADARRSGPNRARRTTAGDANRGGNSDQDRLQLEQRRTGAGTQGTGQGPRPAFSDRADVGGGKGKRGAGPL